MKKFIASLLLLTTLVMTWSSLALEVPGPRSTIYNQNINKAINTDDIDNPLRDWSFMIIDNTDTRENNEAANAVWWIVNVWAITEYNEAKNDVMKIIKNIINYALWLLSFIALIYLIAHWFMILTAAGDDAKYKKWLKGIKYAAIALWWIGVSFFIISFIFRLINIIIYWNN